MNQGARSQSLVEWMESLAEGTRLRILHLLEGTELEVAEMCKVLQMPQSTVSRHLKVLADLKWVHARRSGTANLYRMVVEELDATPGKLWQLAREETSRWPALEQDRLRLQRVLAEREKDAGAFFEGAAGEWDQLRQWLYGKNVSIWAYLGLLPGDWTVADLGCGAGMLTTELAGAVGKVIGVDASAAMLKAARKRATGMGNVEFIKGDLAEIPLPDACCDAALLALVLTYIEQPSLVLQEAARIVRPGGRVVVVDLLLHDREDFRRQFGQRWPGFGKDQMGQWMKDAGWGGIRIKSLPPEAEARGPALQLALGVKK